MTVTEPQDALALPASGAHVRRSNATWQRVAMAVALVNAAIMALLGVAVLGLWTGLADTGRASVILCAPERGCVGSFLADGATAPDVNVQIVRGNMSWVDVPAARFFWDNSHAYARTGWLLVIGGAFIVLATALGLVVWHVARRSWVSSVPKPATSAPVQA